MRDRLIELIKARHLEWLRKEYDRETDKNVCEYLADHLLAEGVIVPPCKVGQTVHCIRYDKARKPFVKPLVVLSITMYGKGGITVFTSKEDTLGKTVFLTREEAEKALAERSGNGT